MWASGRRHAGERGRRAEQRDDVPARDRVRRRRGVLGELPLAEGARLGIVLERVEAAPGIAAHRWHPEQWTGGETGGQLRELPLARRRVAGRLPGHVRDLRCRAKPRAGVAVAVEAPTHAERLDLLHDLHLLDVAVAAHAADARADVGVVVEVGVVGQLVHAHPAHRAPGRGALADRGERLARARDRAVAVHARLRRRHVRDRRGLDRRVAVAAVELELARVQAVAVGHGLDRAVADLEEAGREVVPDEGDRGRRARADLPRPTPAAVDWRTAGRSAPTAYPRPPRARPGQRTEVVAPSDMSTPLLIFVKIRSSP